MQIKPIIEPVDKSTENRVGLPRKSLAKDEGERT
jgi:hypothetical protein